MPSSRAVSGQPGCCGQETRNRWIGRNLNQRIAFGFSVIVLAIVVTGVVAIWSVTTVAELTDKVCRHPLSVSNAVLDANGHLIAIHRIMEGIVLVDDSAAIDTFVVQVDEHERRIYEVLAIVQQRFLGDKQQVEVVLELIRDWKPFRDEVVELMRSGKQSQAAAMTQGQGASHVALINQKMEGLIVFATGTAAEFRAAAEATSSRAITTACASIVVAVVISLIIAVMTLRSLRRAVRERRRTEEALQESQTRLADDAQALARSNKELRQSNTDLNRSRSSALNMMQDAEEARQRAEDAKLSLQQQTQQIERVNAGLEQEIAERKRAEEKLKKLSQAVEHSPASVVITDGQGTIEYVNPRFTRLTGYTSQEVVGETPRILSSGQVPKETIKQLWETILSGEEWRGELLNKKKNGDLYWEFASISPLVDADGKITHFVAVKEDITGRKRTEDDLAALNEQLVNTSRQAGMSEIASGVLHNVGNVLTSVVVAANLAAEKVRASDVDGLTKAVAMLDEHADDLGTFITSDQQGKHLPNYLNQLAQRLAGERDAVLDELRSLLNNVEHIAEIISMQQSYAKVSGTLAPVDLQELVEDSLNVNDAGLLRHSVELTCDFKPLPPVVTDKNKVLQILVNLISNAKYALSDAGKNDRRLVLRIDTSGDDRVKVEVEDNGVGIAEEDLTKIFQHGFTTKESGHGFGLHSSALAAKELGGTLTVHSDGPGRGALFTLELPATIEEEVLCPA